MIVKGALALVLVAAAAGASVTSAERTAHLARMDEIAGLQFDIEDALGTKSGPGLAAGTSKMRDALVAERAYWAKARVPDASATLETAVRLVEAIAAASAAGDIVGARAGFESLGATCVTCHELKADDRVTVRD